MKFNELQVDGNKDRKRVGRGISAGQGKTVVAERRARTLEPATNTMQHLWVARVR